MDLKVSNLALLGAALVLCACGGGGGGGGGNATLTLNTTQLTFTNSRTGSYPATKAVTGTVSGTKRQIYVAVLYSNNGIMGLSGPDFAGYSATSGVQMKPGYELDDGVYHDTVTVFACYDQICNRQVSGSPATVNVTYTVGIPTTPAAVDIEVVEGEAIPAKPVAIAYHGGSAAWSSNVSYTDGSGWLTVQPASGGALPATPSLQASALAPGIYDATTTISVGAETNAIPVNYEVLSLLTFQAPAAFNVNPAQPAAGQVRSVTLTSRVPSRQTTWTAAPAAPTPWLAITQSAGNTATPDALQLQLDAEGVLATPNGTYVAQVVVTPLDGTPVQVPVTLTLDRPFVDAAAPYIVKPGAAGTLIIRGDQLDASPVTDVTIGDTSVTSITPVNASKLTVAYPALTAGDYAVRVHAGGTALGTAARLVVRAPPALAAAGTSETLPVAAVGGTVFDRERDACYFMDGSNVTAIRHVDGAWEKQTVSEALPGFLGAALANSGRDLLALTTTEMVHFDPVTLAVTARTALPELPYGTTLSIPSFATIDDGSVVFGRPPGIWRYEPATRTAGPIQTTNTQAPRVMPSEAGNRVVWHGSTGCCTFPYHMMETAPFTSTTMVNSAEFPAARADLFGERWAFRHAITDATGATTATVPSHVAWGMSLLSRDGNTVYVSDSYTKTCPSCANYEPHIDVYDLSAVAAGGGPSFLRRLGVLPRQLGFELNADETELVHCSSEGVSATSLD